MRLHIFIGSLFLLASFVHHLVWCNTAAAASSSASASAANGVASASSSAASSASANSGKKVLRIVTCDCHKDYNPVCGTNGITYSNECFLHCISEYHAKIGHSCVSLLHRGNCRTLPCDCSKIYAPVCGTNNQTFTNDCHRKCENAFRAERGLPTVNLAYQDVCRSNWCCCPNNTVPVCGDDNRTYKNICLMECISRENECRGQRPIAVQYGGPCKNETCQCTLVEERICASDGNTYYNKCAFDCQNRRQTQLGLEQLTFQYPGSCIRCACFADKEQICGSDWNTYRNYCSFLCNNRIRKRKGQVELVVRWRGACDCGCSEKRPVCVNNHATWPSRCAVDCENKRRKFTGLPRLTITHEGFCKTCAFCNKM